MSSRIAEIPVPLRCRETIRAGTLVAINRSGGKDSQAMTILLSRIVPRGQLLAVHAPLGEVEWPGTIEHIEATLSEGVPLIFAPVASGKTLLERVEERGLWPSNAARWCRASLLRSGAIWPAYDRRGSVRSISTLGASPCVLSASLQATMTT